MRIHQAGLIPGPPTRPRRRWPLGDRSGQVMALFAVTAIPLLAIMALGIDWGLLLTARDEAQRAADSGALAGAAMFRGCSLLECAAMAQPAEDTARFYATRNFIRQTRIDSSEVTVQVDVDERLVRVFVNRGGVPTFFANFLGIPVAPIGAVAAAKVSASGTGQCILPFSGPDLWEESGDENQIPDEGEDWEYDPDEDAYQTVQEDETGTGYGSDHRNGPAPIGVGDDGYSYTNDYGRTIIIKTGSQGAGGGGLGDMAAPGNFLLWRMPDPSTGCTELGQGADFLEENIMGCNECPIELGEGYPLETEPGQKWGKVKSGLDSLIAKDSGAYWDTSTNQVVSDYGEDTPRAVAIALGDPGQWGSINGSDEIIYNNFAKVFVEGYDNGTKQVFAHFMGYVAGGGENPNTGQLVQYLRLVE